MYCINFERNYDVGTISKLILSYLINFNHHPSLTHTQTHTHTYTHTYTHTHTHTHTHARTHFLILMNNIKWHHTPTKIKWKMYSMCNIDTLYTLYLMFWRYFFQPLVILFNFLLIIIFYISRYNFWIFKTLINIIWEKIFITNFLFLMDFSLLLIIVLNQRAYNFCWTKIIYLSIYLSIYLYSNKLYTTKCVNLDLFLVYFRASYLTATT